MSEEQGSELEVANQETEVIEGDKPEVKEVEAKAEETQAPEVKAKTEEAEEGLPDEAKEKTRRRFQKLLKDNEHLRKRIEAAEARLSQQKPTLEQFDHDIEKYTEAAGKHIAETVIAENDLKEATQEVDAAKIQILSSWNEIKQTAAEKYPDFAKVFDATVDVTQTMAEALVQLDNSADVAYYLGQHREEAADIASLPIAMQGFEMARLAMRVKPKPKDTSAPPPPTALARGAGNAGKKRWEDMGDAEFSATRAKERAAWRKEHM